jgi:hypothetical protein
MGLFGTRPKPATTMESATLSGELFGCHTHHGTVNAKTVAATSQGEQPSTNFFPVAAEL